MDILVELEDGSIANVEMQKIGYLFPGQRAACYSSDLLLRQYSRVKSELGKQFSYKDIKNVYTIVFLEKSSSEFHAFPTEYYHHAEQHFDTGLALNLLQEYIYIPLDIFLDIFHNTKQNISNELDAWLCFLGCDDFSDIEKLLEAYPWFIDLYADIVKFQRNPKELIGMYSEALKILDRNTVQLMVEEQQKEIEKTQEKIKELDSVIQEKEAVLQEKEIALQQKETALQQKDAEIEYLKSQLKLE